MIFLQKKYMCFVPFVWRVLLPVYKVDFTFTYTVQAEHVLKMIHTDLGPN